MSSEVKAMPRWIPLTSWGLAGFAGSYVAGILLDATKSYLTPFLVAAVIEAIGLILLAITEPPAKVSV
ncbi:MAG: hypothetical protein H5U02_14215 [Clostridia bacterium]|nr:hypothetical protein [Clostridia bacterium]